MRPLSVAQAYSGSERHVTVSGLGVVWRLAASEFWLLAQTRKRGRSIAVHSTLRQGVRPRQVRQVVPPATVEKTLLAG